MALMQINVIPLGSGASSIGEFIAGIQKFLASEQISCTLTDMGTVVEGNPVELFEVAAKIHELPFDKGIKRVITQIVIDDRRDKEVRIGDKVASIGDRLRVSDG